MGLGERRKNYDKTSGRLAFDCSGLMLALKFPLKFQFRELPNSFYRYLLLTFIGACK
jgi:hypothetical protein